MIQLLLLYNVIFGLRCILNILRRTEEERYWLFVRVQTRNVSTEIPF